LAATPAAVVAELEDLAEALVAQVPVLAHLVVEARLPVLAVLAHLVVKAQLVDSADLEVEAGVLAHLVVRAQLLDLAERALVADPADLVLVAAVPLQRLLSRQSFSAAMARNTP
jgi:hypothetical protein